MNNTHITLHRNWCLRHCLLTGLIMIMAGWSLPLVAQTSPLTVSGTVVSETDREPLIGVTVRVKTGNNGTVTDLNGAFTIQTAMGQTLVFSYIGHQTKEVTVSGSTLQIVLEEGDKTASLLKCITTTPGTFAVTKPPRPKRCGGNRSPNMAMCHPGGRNPTC